MALNAFKLVELRLLEQGRATASDGRDWIRMAIGIAAMVPLTLVVAKVSLDTGIGVWPTIATAALGVVFTTWWIVTTGKSVAQWRIAGLRQA